MPDAQVGQRVNVDISGLQSPGISIGGGVASTGTIIGIDAARGIISVQLDVSFNDQNVVDVSPNRVTLLG